VTDDLSFYEKASEAGAVKGRMTKDAPPGGDMTGLILPAPLKPPDPARGEAWCPAFDGTDASPKHLIPAVPRALWTLKRQLDAGNVGPPPWRLRVSPRLCWAYTMERIAPALAPHAVIVMTPDGRHPAPMLTPGMDIEYVIADNPAHPADPLVGSSIILPGQFARR
jgi:hypothetical protein